MTELIFSIRHFAVFAAAYSVAFGACLLTLTKPQRVTTQMATVVLTIVFLLLVGLRLPRFGSDTPNYVGFFERARHLTLGEMFRRFSWSSEYLYWLLTWTLSRITANSNVFVLSITAVGVAAFVAAYARFEGIEKQDSHWYILAFFTGAAGYLLLGNILRQGVSAGFAMLAMVAFARNRKSEPYAWATAAVLFHLSSLVVLAAVIILRLTKIRARTLGWIVVIGLIVSEPVTRVLASAGIPIISGQLAMYLSWPRELDYYLQLALLGVLLAVYAKLGIQQGRFDEKHRRLFLLLLTLSTTVTLSFAIQEASSRLLIFAYPIHPILLVRLIKTSRFPVIAHGAFLFALVLIFGLVLFHPGIAANFRYPGT